MPPEEEMGSIGNISEMIAQQDEIMREANMANVGLTRAQVESLQEQMADRMANPPIIIQTNTTGEPNVGPGQTIGVSAITFTGLSAFYRAPRTSADIPMGTSQARHTVSRINMPGSEPIQCSCGWCVSEAYLVGMSSRDIGGMVDAHIAGGLVGPQQNKAPRVGDWVDDGKGSYVQYELPKWETPEISEPSFSPRRKITLEDS